MQVQKGTESKDLYILLFDLRSVLEQFNDNFRKCEKAKKRNIERSLNRMKRQIEEEKEGIEKMMRETEVISKVIQNSVGKEVNER